MTIKRVKECTRANCSGFSYSVSRGGMCETHLRIAGMRLPMVPNDIVMDFLEPWLTAGYPMKSLLDTAGVGRGVSRSLRDGRDMEGKNFRQIVSTMDPEKCHWQPAYRAQRRLCSLRGAGMSGAQLVEATGLSRSMVNNYCYQHTGLLRLERFSRIMEVWDANKIRTPTKPDDVATERGFPLPMSWIDIDDPYEGRGGIAPAVRRVYERKSA